MWLRHKGAAAIEFALVLPLYLLVLDGVMELSMVLYDQAIVLNAAREATRAGVVVTTPKMSNADIALLAQTYASNYLLSFGDADSLTVTVNQSIDGAYQTPLSVTVAYTYNSLLAGNFLAAIHKPVQLSSTVTLFNE
jgi:Flp pilus assembly protein TadG